MPFYTQDELDKIVHEARGAAFREGLIAANRLLDLAHEQLCRAGHLEAARGA